MGRVEASSDHKEKINMCGIFASVSPTNTNLSESIVIKMIKSVYEFQENN